jgi:Fe-S cluster assembly protein SufD
VSTFSPDSAADLAGPAWLQEQRQAAFERFRALPLPSTEEEIWRYSRIAELDLDAVAPSPDPVTVTGWQPSGSSVPQDVVVASFAERPDLFADLNAAFADRPQLVEVAPGRTVTDPIVVDHHITVDGGAVFPRLVVDVGEDAEVTVVERFTSDDVTALVVPMVAVQAHQSARVRYVSVNQLGPRVWLIGHQVARGHRDSSTLLATIALGGDYARVRTDARLVGQGAEGDQIAVYFGEAHQMHDFRTLQDHAAPKTRSNLLFKGAVQGHAQSVYTGLIKVRKDARGTDAFQTNRNLKLSEHAWAESVPNLEIETNDVRCSHASTVGPIDEEQRFYLESRGVPPGLAERLIVLGFFNEVFDRLPVPSLVPELVAEVSAKLDRRDDR